MTLASGASQTLAVMTPAFEAYPSSDTNIASSTSVKVPANTEKFDTNSCYDNSTNYRFTPTVAGKYFCYMSYSYNIVAGNVGLVAEIKKNGTAVLSGKYGASSNSSDNIKKWFLKTNQITNIFITIFISILLFSRCSCAHIS